jgi:hypothetical protein
MTIEYSKSREERKLHSKHGAVLVELFTLFIKDCLIKPEDVIKKKYKEYERRWFDYANKINTQNKGQIIFLDEFEASMLNFYDKTKKMGDSIVQQEYKRVARIIVNEQSTFKRIINFIRRKFNAK